MMRDRKLLVVGLLLLFGGLAGRFMLSANAEPGWWNMRDHKMMGKGMMGWNGMRKKMPPAIDPSLLPDADSKGALLLQRFCNQCHGLPGPGLHTQEEWPNVIARMNRRMQMMSRHDMMMKIDAPDKVELQTLQTYLQAHAQRTIDAEQLPDSDSVGASAFKNTCVQCHALPDPSQHRAAEWPMVVARMQKNMATMGKPVVEKKTIDDILAYLQQHSENQ